MRKSAMTPRLFLLLLLIFTLDGCGESRGERNTTTSPRLMKENAPLRGIAPRHNAPSAPSGADRELRELELAHRERLAAIEAEKEKALKTLETERTRSVETTRRRIAEIEASNALKLEREKQKYAAIIAEKEKALKAMEANVSLRRDRIREQIVRLENELNEKTLWILSGLLLLLLLAGFLFYRYRKRLEARAREEERRHEAMMLERRLRHEEIGKILELIASDGTPPELKMELVRLLDRNGSDPSDPIRLPSRLPDPEKPESGSPPSP
jgi:hypothetical protein